jgi:FtsZ-interacting cell division protein ZipA
MALWLLIGVVFAAVLLLALWRGRSRTASTFDDQSADPNEHKRGADVFAADAARVTDARIERIGPNRGGFTF